MFQSTRKTKEEYNKVLKDFNSNIDNAIHGSHKMVKKGDLKVKLNGSERSITPVQFKDQESEEICICNACTKQRDAGEKPLHSES